MLRGTIANLTNDHGMFSLSIQASCPTATSCETRITFIDGDEERALLRGIPIEGSSLGRTTFSKSRVSADPTAELPIVESDRRIHDAIRYLMIINESLLRFLATAIASGTQVCWRSVMLARLSGILSAITTRWTST